MKEEKFDTIYEKVLATALNLMYLMRHDRKLNIENPNKNYYREVLNNLKINPDLIRYPDTMDINELYSIEEEIEKEDLDTEKKEIFPD